MTPAQKANSIRRKGEKLRRLAYELEKDAADMRYLGLESAANGVKAISSQVGDIGRGLCD